MWSVATGKISSAYSEGYKAGLLASYPDRAYWESLAKNVQSAAKISAGATSPGWGLTIGLSAGTLVIGFAAGVLYAVTAK